MVHTSTHGARKPPGPKKRRGEKDWTMMKTMAKLRMAHASTHGARKPPGPIKYKHENLFSVFTSARSWCRRCMTDVVFVVFRHQRCVHACTDLAKIHTTSSISFGFKTSLSIRRIVWDLDRAHTCFSPFACLLCMQSNFFGIFLFRHLQMMCIPKFNSLETLEVV